LGGKHGVGKKVGDFPSQKKFVKRGGFWGGSRIGLLKWEKKKKGAQRRKGVLQRKISDKKKNLARRGSGEETGIHSTRAGWRGRVFPTR